MTERFHKANIQNFMFCNGVSIADARIHATHPSTKKTESCMFGHLQMLRKFITETTIPYGVFCEDDILLDAEFKQKILHVLRGMKTLNLDLCLCGYLIKCPIDDSLSEFFTEKHRIDGIRFYDYASLTIWGTQMYILTRAQARRLLTLYDKDDSRICSPFSADWTITQQGHKMLIYPMLAIEDGQSTYEDAGQALMHHLAYASHLDVSHYI
jgi:GR25 family glycosyltransferase involved in LPS biosynthesis